MSKAASQRAQEVLSRVWDIERPVVIEVGVFQGTMSKYLLAGHEGLQLYMIDSWLPEEQQPDHYKATNDFHSTQTKAQAESYYNKAMGVAESYKGRAHVIRMDSVSASKYFQNRTADLVFLDADHSYEGVIADINSYADISRGWIGGHDYNNPEKPYDFSGVDKAVHEVFGDDFETGANFTWFKCLHVS